MIGHLGEHKYPLKECLMQKKCIKNQIFIQFCEHFYCKLNHTQEHRNVQCEYSAHISDCKLTLS